MLAQHWYRNHKICYWWVHYLKLSNFLQSSLNMGFPVLVNNTFNGAPRFFISWWHHQMETFSVLLALCAGNSPVTSEFPSPRAMRRSFDVSSDPRLNKDREADDLRCHHAHYDVIIMISTILNKQIMIMMFLNHFHELLQFTLVPFT